MFEILSLYWIDRTHLKDVPFCKWIFVRRICPLDNPEPMFTCQMQKAFSNWIIAVHLLTV